MIPKTAIYLTAFLVAKLQAAVLVVPNTLGNSSGNSSSVGVYNSSAATLQMQIAAGQLTAAAGSIFAGISFRLDEGVGASPAQQIFADYEITLAGAQNPFGSISTTLADNMANPDKVRDGGLTIPAAAITSGGSPNAFSYMIPFDHGYTYGGGDLVVHISYSGNGAASYAVDAANNSTTGYGNVVGGQFYAQSPVLTSLPFPVTELEFVPVPEPAGYVAVAGLCLLAFAAWRRFAG